MSDAVLEFSVFLAIFVIACIIAGAAFGLGWSLVT